MCYAFKPASDPALPGIRIAPDSDTATKDGFHYAKDTVPVVLNGGEKRWMRWDLIPRGFLRNENPTLAEAIRKKNSRAINPSTGKSWGFSSYNARIETVDKLWTFKETWQDHNRGVISIEAFRERPNMDGAPEDSKGREYEITLDKPYFLAALYDTWKSRDGESLESCTVITGPSDHIPALQNIWHERTPILLSEEAASMWLDPATTPKAAMALLRTAKVPEMIVKEVPKKAPQIRPEKKAKAKKEEDPSLDLFGA